MALLSFSKEFNEHSRNSVSLSLDKNLALRQIRSAFLYDDAFLLFPIVVASLSKANCATKLEKGRSGKVGQEERKNILLDPSVGEKGFRIALGYFGASLQEGQKFFL